MAMPTPEEIRERELKTSNACDVIDLYCRMYDLSPEIVRKTIHRSGVNIIKAILEKEFPPKVAFVPHAPPFPRNADKSQP
jgi:hypothetical protein